MRISDFPISNALTGDESIPILDPNEVLSKKRNKRILLNQILNAHGPTGPSGKSAYDLWLSAGNTGPLSKFLNSLIGKGKSAYEIWLEEGHVGTKEDFLSDISTIVTKIFCGTTVPANTLGNDEDYYINTVTGEFYYKLNGSWGNPLFSIKGLQGPIGSIGPTGPQGPQGPIGLTGPQGPAGSTSVPSNMLINAQTGTSYTATLADAGGVVEMDNAASNTFIVPNNNIVAFNVGDVLSVRQYGAGVTTIVAASGVTINTPASLVIASRYGMVTIHKRSTNEWSIEGRLQ